MPQKQQIIQTASVWILDSCLHFVAKPFSKPHICLQSQLTRDREMYTIPHTYSLVMSEEALTIKRNITMILHICGKEDPWCHFSNPQFHIHTLQLCKHGWKFHSSVTKAKALSNCTCRIHHNLGIKISKYSKNILRDIMQGYLFRGLKAWKQTRHKEPLPKTIFKLKIWFLGEAKI